MTHTNPCGHATRHTSRIGCCSGCGLLFSSDTAHDRHRRDHRCLPPESVGMVAKPSRTGPGDVIWGMPGGDWR